jgi:PncC family amidohydrolase
MTRESGGTRAPHYRTLADRQRNARLALERPRALSGRAGGSKGIENLLPIAARIAARLKERGETVAIAESSAAGLISAALVAQSGASAFFVGGAVVYTLESRRNLLGIPDEAVKGLRASTETYVLLAARAVRERLQASWGLAESGASGPSGNRYGDPPGHACVAVSGATERALTIETGRADRVENMVVFAERALRLLAEAIGA